MEGELHHLYINYYQTRMEQQRNRSGDICIQAKTKTPELNYTKLTFVCWNGQMIHIECHPDDVGKIDVKTFNYPWRKLFK